MEPAIGSMLLPNIWMEIFLSGSVRVVGARFVRPAAGRRASPRLAWLLWARSDESSTRQHFRRFPKIFNAKESGQVRKMQC